MEQQSEFPMLQTTEQLDQLAVALAAAQAEFPPIPKNHTARIRPREKAAYEFKYADLADILAAVRPALSKNGLAVVQIVNHAWLETVLLHSSGQRVVSRTKLFALQSEPKAFGAELTYLRRYALSAIIGVASEDDIDENGDEPTEPRGAPEIRQPSRKKVAESAEAPAGDSGVLASDGERKWLTNRAGDALDATLKDVGATSLESLTKAQFLAAKSNLLRAA